MDSDAILVFAHGEIVERGTHSALVHQGGVYSNMWSRQADVHIKGKPVDEQSSAFENGRGSEDSTAEDSAESRHGGGEEEETSGLLRSPTETQLRLKSCGSRT